MGHRFVTLRPDTDKTHGDGQYSCAMESNDLRSASQWLKGEPIPRGWRVFERTKRGWKEVFPWHIHFRVYSSDYQHPPRQWEAWEYREPGRGRLISQKPTLKECRAEAFSVLLAATQ